MSAAAPVGRALPFGAFLLALAFEFGCGGESSTRGTASSGAGPAGGMSAGGALSGGAGAERGGEATQSGGAPSGSGGQVSPDPSCTERKPTDGCVATCSEKGDLQQRACVNNRWSCPSGHVSLADCDARSCARANVTCCNDTNGAITNPGCGPDGMVEDCPSEGHELTDSLDCIPHSLGVSDCYALSGACPTEALTCSSGVRCGRQCVCEKDASGALKWACSDKICG